MNTALNKRFNTTLIDKDLKISDYTLLGLILSYREVQFHTVIFK